MAILASAASHLGLRRPSDGEGHGTLHGGMAGGREEGRQTTPLSKRAGASAIKGPARGQNSTRTARAPGTDAATAQGLRKDETRGRALRCAARTADLLWD